MNDSNGAGKPRKRRVNPALLLGADSGVKGDAQSGLAEAEDFVSEGSRKPVNNFRGGSLVADEVDDDIVVDLETGEVDAPGLLDDSSHDSDDTGFVSVPVVDSSSDVVEPVRNDVIERNGGKGSSGAGGKVERPRPVKDSGDEDSKKSRKVNPMFLVGEEKDTSSSTGGSSGKVKKPRPGFMLDSDKVPARRPQIDLDELQAGFEEERAVVDRVETKKAHADLLNLDDEVDVEVLRELGKEDETPLFTKKKNPKPRSQYSRKMDSSLGSGDWSEDDDEGSQFGLGGEVDSGYVKPQYEKGFHLTERDLLIMRFLARYRYAYVEQIARLVDTTPRTISARLRVLEKRGFLRRESVTGKQYLWTTRKAGNVLADINFPEIKKGTISYATIAHTIGLGNLGVEFEREAGGEDLLGEGKGVEGWVQPQRRWKMGMRGNPDGMTFGEMTVTEREIRQGQMRWRGNRDTKTMRALVTAAASDVEYAAELEEGNEGLFVVYGAGGKGGEHIPDLVIARERDENGRPQHIAVELELTPKTNPEWRKILRNYRDNGEMYSKIYYFTHKRSIGNALVRLAADEGLSDKFVVRKYLPKNAMPFWG